jgi:hypothetical protein
VIVDELWPPWRSALRRFEEDFELDDVDPTQDLMGTRRYLAYSKVVRPTREALHERARVELGAPGSGREPRPRSDSEGSGDTTPDTPP